MFKGILKFRVDLKGLLNMYWAGLFKGDRANFSVYSAIGAAGVP